MEKQKPTDAMTRHEVLLELAKFAHPTWYHGLLPWTTNWLKALLDFYRAQRVEEIAAIKAGRSTGDRKDLIAPKVLELEGAGIFLITKTAKI